MALAWDFATLRGPAEWTMRLRAINVRVVSPFDGSDEVWPRYEQWEAIGDWPILSGDQYHGLSGHLVRGEGRSTALQIPCFDYRVQRGNKTGTITFAAASAGANSITISGGAGVFARGDRFQLTQATNVPRVYQVVSTESAGVLTFRPPLTTSYPSGGTLTHLANLAAGQFLLETMELTSDLGAAAFPTAESGAHSFRSMSVSFESSRKPFP